MSKDQTQIYFRLIYLSRERERMLFSGNPKGRSMMTSCANKFFKGLSESASILGLRGYFSISKSWYDLAYWSNNNFGATHSARPSHQFFYPILWCGLNHFWSYQLRRILRRSRFQQTIIIDPNPATVFFWRASSDTGRGSPREVAAALYLPQGAWLEVPSGCAALRAHELPWRRANVCKWVLLFLYASVSVCVKECVLSMYVCVCISVCVCAFMYVCVCAWI